MYSSWWSLVVYWLLYIYIDYHIYDLLFRVWSEWLELSATYWQSSSSLQRLEIGNEENYLKNWKWWKLFEILEKMRIIFFLKYRQWGGRGRLFCVPYKSFSSEIEFKFSAECTHLGPLKKFVTLLRFFLIFSDEIQTTRCCSINFLLIGSLLLFFSNVVICSSCQGRFVNVGWRPDNSILLIFFPPNPFPFTFF